MGECFQWKATGECAEVDSCCFNHGSRSGQRAPSYSSTLRTPSDDAMSRTKQSWSCSYQRVKAGNAHALRMVRLHIGDYHMSALTDDDDIITKNHNLESCTHTLTKATPFALWKTVCQGLLCISNLQAFKGATGKITIFSITGGAD